MCIKVRVTYLRCSHVHLGYELCVEIDSDNGYCSNFETHSRIDPFCPSCSKLDHRTSKLQSTREIKAPQHSDAIIRHDDGVGKQKGADESKRTSLNSSVSDSSLYSEVHSLNPYIPPPSPIEPPIDPGLLGPHQFLEYRQRLAMVVVADHRPRLSPKDWSRS